jgi:hypothetical protein
MEVRSLQRPPFVRRHILKANGRRHNKARAEPFMIQRLDLRTALLPRKLDSEIALPTSSVVQRALKGKRFDSWLSTLSSVRYPKDSRRLEGAALGTKFARPLPPIGSDPMTPAYEALFTRKSSA